VPAERSAIAVFESIAIVAVLVAIAGGRDPSPLPRCLRGKERTASPRGARPRGGGRSAFSISASVVGLATEEPVRSCEVANRKASKSEWISVPFAPCSVK
jgi:hypothetical protein